VQRKTREKSRKELSSTLEVLAQQYPFGTPKKLPFGMIYPQDGGATGFYDFQIEGVGTKTLIAEAAGKYDTIGIDAVAMAVNDVIRSGAMPFLLSDAIHISKSSGPIVRSILRGVKTGSKISNCTLGSGETGDVGDILHLPLGPKSVPFDLFVSALGFVRAQNVITGRINTGDMIIGLESSGIHSNGLSLARKVLLKNWGGKYGLNDTPDLLGGRITLGEELLRPTRIYVAPIEDLHKKVNLKAVIHITGDGFSKFRRLLEFQRKGLGLEFFSLGEPPAIFDLIEETALSMRRRLSKVEMFRTFNMGYGFSLVVSRKDEDLSLDLLNRYCPARTIGRVVSSGTPRIQLKGVADNGKTISL